MTSYWVIAGVTAYVRVHVTAEDRDAAMDAATDHADAIFARAGDAVRHFGIDLTSPADVVDVVEAE